MASLTSDPSSADKEKQFIDTPPEVGNGIVTEDGPVSPGRDQDTALAILDLVKAKDVHHPIHWPAWKRWGIVIVYVSLSPDFGRI
jgi:hypothetical protein